MKDADILHLLRSGRQHKAMQKLYAYYPVIKKMIRNNNGTSQDAEDIYQEALIVFCRKTAEPGFELRSSINTYLYSVCRFMWNDELKRKGRQLTETLAEELPEEAGISETVYEENTMRQAERAFQLLGEKCRELLLLFYIEKLSLKEITVKLKFSTEKVAKNQKYRCLSKAKENLKTLTA